jgi:hypothetical protein
MSYQKCLTDLRQRVKKLDRDSTETIAQTVAASYIDSLTTGESPRLMDFLNICPPEVAKILAALCYGNIRGQFAAALD